MTTSPSSDDLKVSPEAARLFAEALTMLGRMNHRLTGAMHDGDADTVRWIWKQIVSVERRAQERAGR